MNNKAVASIFPVSARASAIHARIRAFMCDRVLPNEETFQKQIEEGPTPWTTPPILDDLKREARAEGLWNLFLPDLEGGAGLSNLEYAPLAEEMGRVFWASEVFNCNAPDTGNMEVLHRYGDVDQKEKWLKPLLEGEIRSCFAMTEPAVASSDATNIETSIRCDGDVYVVNGRKWWTTGAMNPRCRVAIVMGKSDPNAARHSQQSMILVPMDAPGVRIVRPLRTLGFDEPPHGHAELLFENVRVPRSNMILGEGRGFEIAQGRLGPGRIHHCMRLIGLAERALEAMCIRAKARVAFGKRLSEQGSVRENIALSRVAIDQVRLLVMKAAHMIDLQGAKAARKEIAMIKVAAPRMAQSVIDRAIQVHGGAGLSDDFFLGYAFTGARILRLADGPDEVHLESVARLELGRGETARAPS
ncbi:MAG: acyl-CoA dehydrogenase [Hyphomonas sp.]|nr:acyl-CoA dehydrogenase [Hyphomonas sp.]